MIDIRDDSANHPGLLFIIEFGDATPVLDPEPMAVPVPNAIVHLMLRTLILQDGFGDLVKQRSILWVNSLAPFGLRLWCAVFVLTQQGQEAFAANYLVILCAVFPSAGAGCRQGEMEVCLQSQALFFFAQTGERSFDVP